MAVPDSGIMEVWAVRKLMWFSVGFGAACALASYFYLPKLHLLALLAALISALFWVIGVRAGNFRIPAVLFCGFAVGMGWFAVVDRIYLKDARDLHGVTADLSVTATDYGNPTDYGVSVTGKIRLSGKTYSVKIYLDEAIELKPGDQIDGSFRCQVTTRTDTNDADYIRSEGIWLVLFQEGDLTVTLCDKIPARYQPALWRVWLLQSMNEAFPEDVSGFAKALLLGDRSGIDYEMNTAFKLSGISHIIAVSGLHVSILFGLIYTLTGRKRYLTGIVGIPALLLFAAVAGFTPSITRACIMQSLVLIAMMTNREYDPPTSLGFAVLCMLIVNPMSIVSISFQLSVACMAGIFLLSGRIQGWLTDDKRFGSVKGAGILPKLKRWVVSSVSISLASSVLTTPLVAIYFDCVSLVGVLTNLLTLWIITYTFYGIMLVCLLGLAGGGVAAAIGLVVAWPIRYVITAAKLMAAFPLAAVYTQSVYIVAWLACCYCMLIFYLILKEKPVLIYACCAVITLCAALFASWMEPLTDPYRMTVLDVGQGQSILLQSSGKTYLVDCGGDNPTRAADVTAEYLLSRGIFRLDGIIVTHYDDDHVGAVPYLLTRVKADTLFLPVISDGMDIGNQLAQSHSDPYWVTEDLLLSFDGTKMTLFGPENTEDGNEGGLCVLFQPENCDILITGDRGALGEMLLLHRTELPELEILVAGHHGSAYSTGDALLSATTPETVMISVGANNNYGHPASALLDRLEQYGCDVYRTDHHGTIVYRG